MAFKALAPESGLPVDRSISLGWKYRVRRLWETRMDSRELLGYLFAVVALALLVTGIWAISYYAPARRYERELRRERRARHRRRELEGSDSSNG
jgi:hypothetical protein